MRKRLLSLCGSVVVLLLLAGVSPQALVAQEQGTITGTVTNAQSGAPLAGAQVSIRGTGLGILTNEEGVFLLLNVPAGRVEVRVEYIGYSPEAQTVDVGAGQTVVLDFQMGVTAIELEELVATGYATATRREVSSAISTVRSLDLENPAVASLDAVLLGKAPGVQVTQNAGNPGNGITVRIRGSSSIEASNQPLYVVDGMPIYREDFAQLGFQGQDLNAITGLNPEEIESVDILKDAAAAAIYGSRGSNGVVLITTKRGAVTRGEGGSGQPRFQFSSSYGLQEASKKIDMMNTAEWIEYHAAGFRYDGYSESEIQDIWDAYGINNTYDTDWQEEVMRTAPISTTTLSMSGGTGRFNYLVSGSYFDQEGIILGSSYSRGNGRMNLDFQATDRLNVSTSVSVAKESNFRIVSDNSIASAVTNAIANEPWAPVYEADGTYSGRASYANPVGIGKEDHGEALTIRTFGTVLAEYQVVPWLRASGRAGFDVLDLREERYNSPLILWGSGHGRDGRMTIANNQGRKTLLEGYLTADRSYGTHDFTVTAGGSVERNTREQQYLRTDGFTSTELQYPTNAALVSGYDGTRWDHNLMSAFGRATWGWGNRLVVNGSLRTDGSSRFGPNSKWGTFPAASVAWFVGNETFMGDQDLITDLKLRLSWGKTGNESIGNFKYLGLYDTSNYGKYPGSAPDGIPNPDLAWEKTTEWNIGLDFSILSDRLGVVAELYKKETDDLLLDRPVTSTSGFTEVTANVGAIENRGWELSLRTVNMRADRPGSLEWTTDFSITHNENEVTKLYSPDPNLPGEPFGGTNRVEEGHPIGEFYMYHFEGVDPETGKGLFTDLDADGNRIGTTTSPSSSDRMFVGTPHPKYYGGFRNRLRWAGFDLMAFFQYATGHKIRNGMRTYSDDGGYYWDNKFADALVDYWTPDNPNASKPAPSSSGRTGYRYNSDRRLEDASHVRLQEVTLGFTLPDRLAAAVRAQQVRLYLTGRNLYTWSDYTGYAPDVHSGGSSSGASFLAWDFYTYPLARTFTFGFQGTW